MSEVELDQAAKASVAIEFRARTVHDVVDSDREKCG